MNPDTVDRLRGAHNLRAFKDAVLALCRPFGPVKSWDFIHNKRKSRVLCFVELESQEQHVALSVELGGYPFGGCVCLEIPVPVDFAGSEPISSLSEATEPETELRESWSSQQRGSQLAPTTRRAK